MDNKKLQERFEEDCKTLGIELFDLNNESGPWRDLYLYHASKGKPGKTNSAERISRIGIRLMQKRESNIPFKQAYRDIINEFKAMKEQGDLDGAYDFNLPQGGAKRILEDYRKLFDQGEEQGKEKIESPDYYNPAYKPTKLSKDGTE